jgi:hypothetical protein
MPARGVGRGPQPPPQARKLGTAVRANADELAVEQHPVAVESALDRRELGELVGGVAARPRAQANGAPAAAQLETRALELHLDGPPVPTGYGPRTRQHRRHESRKVLS